MTGQGIVVSEVGSFHTGGRIVSLRNQPRRAMQVAGSGPDRIVDLNGDYLTGQCYVQFIKQLRPRSATPVMFWHGGAMTGVAWETTPDGRPGWQMFFLTRGYDVFVCDAVERGRAGWSPFPEIYEGRPIFRTMNEAWTLFRIGPQGGYAADPARRIVHRGQRFPVEAYETFCAQFVPRWIDHADLTISAYLKALKRVGPVVLVAHSQGGSLALEAALRRPDLFRAVVVVEPAAAPDLKDADLAAASRVPHLVLWGDFIEDDPLWPDYRRCVERHTRELVAHGGTVDTVRLPEHGIHGNSHVPMSDRNSDEVAAIVEQWIGRHLEPAD